MHTFFNPDASYIFGQWAFIKLLSLTYFIAFWSLFVQVKGLYGTHGIIPMTEIFKGMRRSKYYLHFYYTPSLFWVSTSDRMLLGTAVVGMFCAVIAFCGYAVPLMLTILCFLYLSYLSTCIYFFSFQWDTLLVEVGFAGIIFSIQTPPQPIAVFMMWVILFRFMFSSGFVKYFTGSDEWRDLTAMHYHYETQPLPNKLAYYFHHYPRWFSKLSTAVVLIVELIVPFMIFINDEFRFAAFCLFVLFQLLIILTGNFAFFNLLTLALCFPLIEDQNLPFVTQHLAVDATPFTLVTSILVSMACTLLIVLNFFQFAQLFRKLPSTERALRFFAPFFIVNHYGLFSHLTTVRFEIEIEGSNDGNDWKAYDFKWKPGNLKVSPKQVAPHQPRLDWQMWFAALGHPRQNPWFIRLLSRLLDGSVDVLNLLKNNPFPEAPPKYIRAQLYTYRYTTTAEKNETGEWWKREFAGVYVPPISK